MTRPRLVHSRPALLGAVVIAAVLALPAIASAATAKRAPQFRRGHLPAIGEIKLLPKPHGGAVVTVPVTYTKATSPDTPGLEFSEATLTVAGRLRHGRAVGTELRRTRRHPVRGTSTVVEHFRIPPRVAHRLSALPRSLRGRLVRIDVRHRIRDAAGAEPMHEKDSSLTMASSHQAKPQGEAAAITVRNDTAVPLQLSSEPILCMYTDGEGGSNLQAFTTPEGEPLPPGATIEAKVEGSANALESAEYQGGTHEGAGRWFDWEGLVVDAVANAFEVEITPILLAWDFVEHCDAQASTFLLVAGKESGEALSTQSWVVTSATCRIGCVHTNLPTAGEALGVQGVGEEEINPGVWAHDSTEVLKGLVDGNLLQNRGLEWSRAELPEAEEEEWWYFPGEYGEEADLVPVMRKAFELSVHEIPGSSG
jgi:hypothetical protein